MAGQLLAVGDTAPDFQVKSHTGADIQLSQYRGKTVVLWFYPKADTPGCTKEGCGFRDRSPEFAIKGAQIFGVSFDTEAENKAFAEKFAYDFPLLCDTERAIGLAYGACETAEANNAKRISYVIDPNGVIQHVYAKVDTSTHAQDILGVI